MAQTRFDGLVEVVRYLPSGLIDIVRVYERRGPTFTDRIILDRETLISRLKEGKKYVTGNRVPLLSSTFQVNSIIKLFKTPRGEYLGTGEAILEKDDLQGTPLF